MSRIGKQPVPVVKGVSVTITEDTITAKGPKGELSMDRHPLTDVVEEDGALIVKPRNNSKPARSAYGLMRALCANMVHGVSQGFARDLEINGVGYRAEVKGDTIVFQLGYSHPIDFKLPQGISAKIEKNMLTLSGIDKALLGQIAANIRSLRPPEPYKGKGIKYKEENILRKVGKAAG
ncbi:MAG: 50S ribosomal protein L6 [Haliangiales bacterium]